MTFGNKLNSLRQQRGIRQKELADFLNVTISTISNYEKNVHSPDIYILSKIADYFGVTTDFLLERTAHPYPSELQNMSVISKYSMGELMEIILAMPEDSKSDLEKYIGYLTYRDIRMR